MKERISKITQRWFLCEEALFVVFCTHRLVENSSIKCPIRTGKGLIEVNPKLCDDMTDIELEEYLGLEVNPYRPLLTKELEYIGLTLFPTGTKEKYSFCTSPPAKKVNNCPNNFTSQSFGIKPISVCLKFVSFIQLEFDAHSDKVSIYFGAKLSNSLVELR